MFPGFILWTIYWSWITFGIFLHQIFGGHLPIHFGHARRNNTTIMMGRSSWDLSRLHKGCHGPRYHYKLFTNLYQTFQKFYHSFITSSLFQTILIMEELPETNMWRWEITTFDWCLDPTGLKHCWLIFLHRKMNNGSQTLL